MKRTLFRNIQIILTILVSASLFQNCSLADKNKQSSYSKFKSHQTTGLKCPVYLTPSCDLKSTLRLVQNELGCKYHVCEQDRKLTMCPTQSTPLCKAHEEILSFKDHNSCTFSKCVLKSLGDKVVKVESPLKEIIDLKTEPEQQKCPPIESGQRCADHKIKSLVVDKNSCLSLVCKRKEKFNCPILKNKICDKNETTFSVFNQKGCAKTICKNTASLKCPKRLNSNCKKDELVKINFDENGCKKSFCIKRPIVTKSECSLSKPPRCHSGKNLRVSVLSSGCMHSYCH